MLWTRRIARPFTPPHHVHTVLHRLMPPHHPLCSTSSPPRRMSGTRRGGETAEERAARKAAIKADKAHKRAVREGKLATVDPDYGKKPCDLCGKLVDLLIRCQIDDSGRWRMVCGGTCWRQVSGGVVDGDEQHPHYRYGGLWKNLRAAAK